MAATLSLANFDMAGLSSFISGGKISKAAKK
jgi:hypothetical protein